MDLNVFDIVFIVVLFIFFLTGISRGFIKEIGKLLVNIESIVGAKMLSSIVGSKLYDVCKIHDLLSEKVAEVVQKANFSNLDTLRNTLNAELKNIPFFGSYIGDITSKDYAFTKIFQSGTTTLESEISAELLKFVEPTAKYVFEILGFVISFVVISILLLLIINVINSIFESIRITGFLNNMLGGLLGLLKGVIIYVFVFYLVFLILSFTNSSLIQTMQLSYTYNILVNFKNNLIY